MASLSDLVRAHGDMDEAELDHLHRLVGEWQLLADLSFADLLLLVRHDRHPGAFLCVAQMRPATSATMYGEDLVGAQLPDGEREAVDVAFREQRIVREGDPVWREDVPVREEAIPVRATPGGRVIAVLARDTNVATLRTPSALELSYLASASDLAQMVAESRFPFPGDLEALVNAPRVGDGLLRLDADATVVFASPNAQSALRRLGFTGNLTQSDLSQTIAGLALTQADGMEPTVRPESALESRRPVDTVLVAADGDAAVRMRAIPLLPGGSLIGGLVLVRDITEVRRRDRQLVSKDATIREIHHRVKNNLQTVAALLRLQARRTDSAAARFALEESVRRVTSIAVVHETLSQALDDNVVFDGISDSVTALSADVASTDGGPPTRLRRLGSFGILPSVVATPLALVLSELVSNAVEHGYAGGSGAVQVRVRRSTQGLEVVVADEGGGLPADFSLESGGGLGLQIVRTLVVGEMRGTFAVRSGPDGGTEAVVAVPASMLAG